ncbi:hypothetical protein P7E02_22510 [Enterococcus hulanensis]|uniref:hypothetical protein n=1 Tax=Enterococcus hulanensis TaxID=2559929 RepID=UPI00288C66C6|nr:hypothetical protein [Enterococcus hulanensis]MDT2662675.1 hypothetical protein [Enterococcus hulanensis]
MRLNKQKVFRTALVGYFLASTFILSGAAFANTEASEEVSTVPSTTQSEKAVSSSGPELPTLNSSKEDVPTASTPKVEEPKRELTYEDNRMLEEPKTDSPVPAVHFQEKQLENGLTIKGSVSAGAEVRENVPSRTILSALILQRLTEAGTWQEVHRFSIEGNGVNVTDSAFSFDYEKPVTETGESNYRLAADYTVKYSEEDQEQQKASLDVGSVTKVKEEVQEKPSETASSSQESTNSEQGSTEVTKENTVESSGPKEDSNAEEPIVIDPSTMGTGDDNPKTLGNNSQIPALQDNYREAFQRGMGIVPLFSLNAVYGSRNDFSERQDTAKTSASYPTVYKATYSSRTTVDVEFKLDWHYRGHRVYGWSGADFSNEVDQKAYLFTLFLYVYNQAPNTWTTGGYSAKGNLTLAQLAKSPGLGVVNIDALNNGRWLENVSNNGYTDVWSHNTTTVKFKNIPTNLEVELEYTVSLGSGSNSTFRTFFEFIQSKATELTNISTPVFTVTDGKANSVTLEEGTYKGDTTDDLQDGFLQLYPHKDSNTWYKHSAVAHYHNRADGGKYYGQLVTGLEAGTEYQGGIILNDWLSVPKYSQNTKFSTPNSISALTKKSETIPTTSNDASATFEGTYVVGRIPAHAKQVEVNISTDNVNWTNDSSASATATINTTTKKVTYTHKNLGANKIYYTRFRVKNQNENISNKPGWSLWSVAQSFQTRGVALKVSTPTVDQVNATTNQVTMENGTYTGNVSTNINDINKGSIDLSTDNESTWSGYTGTLPYTTTLNGTYNSLLLTGLSTGTTYKIRVGLKDDSRANVYSNPTGTFYTRNSVNKPIIDTLHLPISRYNASATISGVYGIGPAGTTPAHADKVKVQVKLDGAPNWEDVDSSSSPKLDSQSINTSNTKGTFTISKLKASTKYHVRYQVENQGGWSDWSASEEFVTLAPPPALEIIDAPKLDFGMLQSEKFTQTANLSAASQKNHLTVDNTDTTKGWKLTAALQQLKRTDNPSIVMPWAKLTMPINLQNSTDDGITWSNYATGVDGIPRTMSFNSGDPAQKLWGIVNPTDAQGLFRTEIDWSNVELEVPGNQYELYEGKLVWSLDDTP